jgi:hypothetical protein
MIHLKECLSTRCDKRQIGINCLQRSALLLCRRSAPLSPKGRLRFRPETERGCIGEHAPGKNDCRRPTRPGVHCDTRCEEPREAERLDSCVAGEKSRMGNHLDHIYNHRQHQNRTDQSEINRADPQGALAANSITPPKRLRSRSIEKSGARALVYSSSHNKSRNLENTRLESGREFIACVAAQC